MHECARAATVRCVSDGVVYGLERRTFRQILQQSSPPQAAGLIVALRACQALCALTDAQASALRPTSRPPPTTFETPLDHRHLRPISTPF